MTRSKRRLSQQAWAPNAAIVVAMIEIVLAVVLKGDPFVDVF